MHVALFMPAQLFRVDFFIIKMKNPAEKCRLVAHRVQVVIGGHYLILYQTSLNLYQTIEKCTKLLKFVPNLLKFVPNITVLKTYQK